MEILLIYLTIGAITSGLYQFFIYKKEGSLKYFEDPSDNLNQVVVVFLLWPILILISLEQ